MSPRKSWGCKTIVTDRTMSWTQRKKIFFNICSRIFAKPFDRFFIFFEKLNIDDFRRQFSPRYRWLTYKKKYTTITVTEKSKEWLSQIFHFQTLSHKLLTDRWGDFQFCLENWNFVNLRKTTKLFGKFLGIRKIVRNKWRVPNCSSFRDVRRGI